jgi:PAS domain S-box-containing protein
MPAMGADDAILLEVARGAPCAFYQFHLSPSAKMAIPFVSSEFVSRYGIEPGAPEETATLFLSRVHPDDMGRFREAMARSARSLEPFELEFRFLLPPGAEIWAEARSIPVRDAGGGVTWNGIVTDITARKRAEEALRASEERFRAIFEVAPVGIAQADPVTGLWLAVNPKMCAITGYTQEELLGKKISDLTHPDDRGHDRALFEEVVRGETASYRIEKRYIRKDGSVARVNINMVTLRDASGRPTRTLAMIEDVTDQLRSTRRLALQAAMGLVLAESSSLSEALPRVLQVFGESEGMAFGAWWEPDPDSGALRCAHTWSADPLRCAELERATRALAIRPGEGIPGRAWTTRRAFHAPALGSENVSPRAPIAGRAGFHGAVGFPVLQQGEPAGVVEFFAPEIPGVDPAFAASVESLGGQIAQYLERKRAQEESARYLAGSPAVLYALRVTGDEARITWFSRNIEALTGYPPAEIETGAMAWWLAGIHPDDRPRVRAAARTVLEKGVADMEFRFRRKDGTWFWVRDERRLLRGAEGRATEVVGSWMDVTSRVRLEEQLRQAQKMEAVGQLAGGVAHDFNNLLTVISGNCDLILSGTSADDPHRGPLSDIRAAGERAANLTRQLLAFSRKQVLAPRLVDVHDVISDMERMLRRLIGEDVDLVTDLAADPSWVKVDPGRLEQVVVNLVVNARDAMPRGGRITIGTHTRDAREPVDLEETDGRGGRPGVAISISDTGEGISPEVRLRLFEPFFTTKAVGKGTGLGLATVYGIVKQSGGDITVDSEPGRGATFTVVLPSHTPPARPGPSTSTRAVPRGTETILAVEDEDAVRRIVRIALESTGYTVIEARSGPEALEIAGRHAGKIDLVLTDVVMPEMSGRELAERIEQDHPGIRILFMSGYTDDTVMRHGFVGSSVAFLQKPFSPLTLARKVRDVLDGRADAPERDGPGSGR